jgi:membrane associated rhomboid family serine protease/thioredoxin-like negative regulator of GroEL
MRARRWPVVTFALIALNVIVFLLTFSTIEEQSQQEVRTKLHVLVLAGLHPNLRMTPPVQKFVDNFRTSNPKGWAQAQDPNRQPIDEFDAHVRTMEGMEAQEAMDQLGVDFAGTQSSILDQYAFVPANPSPISYLTANFLHGGWLHLIGNMWFLWLAGFVLEDTWGRAVYAIFYLVAGAVALQFHAWTNAGSIVPTLGASGAVAALMGAFLVRFPRLKITMGWLFWFRFYKFRVAALWLLPLWLLLEVFYGSAGAGSGVAHWAHVGGFVFGAVVAVGLKVSGVEHKLNQAVEQTVSLTADAELTQAEELIEQGQCDQAIAMLVQYATKKPGSLDAALLLPHAYLRKQDMAGYQQAMLQLAQAYARARQPEPAWHTYLDLLQAGGDRKQLPAAPWLEVLRTGEAQGDYDRVLPDLELLAATYPNERQSLLARMAAARILVKVGAPQKALQHYQAAKTSPVPHLDLEPQIEAGIREAQKAMGVATGGATAGR